MTTDSTDRHHCDILVVGAGIAGASAAALLAQHADVLLIEAESQPGYHTTGRSAAFYAESYGSEQIRPLTAASKDFYHKPPPGFSTTPLLAPRGCLHVFDAARRTLAHDRADKLARTIPGIRILTRDEVLDRVPVFRPERIAGAIDDPDCRDMDVAAIHQGYLAAFRRAGGRLLCDAPLLALRREGGGWAAMTGRGPVAARLVLDAAGAWGDRVAAMAGARAVGLVPMRRSVIIFRPAHCAVDNGWPLSIDIEEQYYFKPETGRILASPADETPSEPTDAQPEEIDIAEIVARLGAATRLDVPRIENRWAGLRTFAPDRVPVVGPDPDVPGFFWCVGQGGYGIQTAPAMAALTAARVLGREVPDSLASFGVRAETYDPARFHA
ncbi:MAG: FAD-dependent catabolic D-arginine dehydrogenase DauA [Rhodothalassiaceae bacterium]